MYLLLATIIGFKTFNVVGFRYTPSLCFDTHLPIPLYAQSFAQLPKDLPLTSTSELSPKQVLHLPSPVACHKSYIDGFIQLVGVIAAVL